MTKPQPSLLDVTRGIAERARTAHFHFGEDTLVVAVQHMLWQTIDLFEGLVVLGIRRNNIFALGKVYSNSPIVIAALRQSGVTVVENSAADPGEFDRAFQLDVNRLWEVVQRSVAQRRIRRILILDDGGKCAISMPRELLKRYAVAGVEQTSFGMFVFEKTPPPFAIVSWARSAVKLQIGGPLFSQCLLEKVESHFLAGKRLTGETIGIIGLGSIGSALANLMCRQHDNVLFYEPDPSYQVPECLLGNVTRVDSLEELLLRCEYVFGCSGREPLRDRWPLRYRPGIKLFSASGGDHEFGPIIRDLKTRRGFAVSPATLDLHCDDGPSGPLCVAYHGYPYNFVARDVEAVPTSIVQVETGGLLTGLIQARTHLRFYEDGRARNHGIHRVSPEAQRFVFEAWARAMKRQQIDLQQVYGYEPGLLEAARERCWFIKNSQPTPSLIYDSEWLTEAAMTRMFEERTPSSFGTQGKLQADFRSL